MSESPILSAVRTAGFQLERVFQGLPAELLDAKLVPSTMSPRETMCHLYECYVAYLAHLAGGSHDWAAYEIPADVASDITNQVWTKRAEAVEALIAKNDEDASKTALDYIAMHDSYHIGQLCALRIEKDPSFNPYSLYSE